MSSRNHLLGIAGVPDQSHHVPVARVRADTPPLGLVRVTDKEVFMRTQKKGVVRFRMEV